MPIQFQTPTPLTTRSTIEINRLEKQLTEEWLKRHLIPVITQTSAVSIRLMDWLVTNYSKQHKVLYTYTNGTIQRIFDLHMEYKMTLDSYGRPLFDPFRRGTRITFVVDGETYTTTVGQMLFWHWAEKHQVIDYCAQNADAIDMHMTATHHNRDKNKEKNKKRKRTALSHAPPMKCFIFPLQTRVNFNDDVSKHVASPAAKRQNHGKADPKEQSEDSINSKEK